LNASPLLAKNEDEGKVVVDVVHCPGTG